MTSHEERLSEVGDSACWIDRTCPQCGYLEDGDPPDVCPRCGFVAASPAGVDASPADRDPSASHLARRPGSSTGP